MREKKKWTPTNKVAIEGNGSFSYINPSLPLFFLLPLPLLYPLTFTFSPSVHPFAFSITLNSLFFVPFLLKFQKSLPGMICSFGFQSCISFLFQVLSVFLIHLELSQSGFSPSMEFPIPVCVLFTVNCLKPF